MTSAVLTGSGKGGAISDALVQALAGPKAAAVTAGIICAHLAALFILEQLPGNTSELVFWLWLASSLTLLVYELFKLHELSSITRTIADALGTTGSGQPKAALKQADAINLPRLRRIYSIRFFVLLAIAALGAIIAALAVVALVMPQTS